MTKGLIEIGKNVILLCKRGNVFVDFVKKQFKSMEVIKNVSDCLCKDCESSNFLFVNNEGFIKEY